MSQELSLPPNSPLSPGSLILNLGVGVLLALALRWHFQRFASTLSNREEFGQLLPFVLLTVILITTVVKSSRALSLGLVGALSIVRFRTPLKEPEKLAYLFIAIAMGLGLGAAQTLPTVVASLGILAVMALLRWQRQPVSANNLHLSVNRHEDGDQQPDRYLERSNEVIGRHAVTSDLRCFDTRRHSTEATYFLDIASVDNFSALVGESKQVFPRVGVTCLDQNQRPSV